MNRLAVCLSRRLYTGASSTAPRWFTARRTYCFLPLMMAHIVEVPSVALGLAQQSVCAGQYPI
jgi:hypothetical protein